MLREVGALGDYFLPEFDDRGCGHAGSDAQHDGVPMVTKLDRLGRSARDLHGLGVPHRPLARPAGR